MFPNCVNKIEESIRKREMCVCMCVSHTNPIRHCFCLITFCFPLMVLNSSCPFWIKHQIPKAYTNVERKHSFFPLSSMWRIGDGDTVRLLLCSSLLRSVLIIWQSNAFERWRWNNLHSFYQWQKNFWFTSGSHTY